MLTKNYELNVPGLAELIAAAKPDVKHKGLLAALRAYRGEVSLVDARVTATRGGRDANGSANAYLQKRKVVDVDGQLVHENHETWLQAEVDRDGGDVVRTWRRLKDLDYTLTECAITTLYVTVDRGGPAADNFLQLEINLDDEVLNRRLFDRSGIWGAPRDIQDLNSLAEGGMQREREQMTQYRPPAYNLRQVVDVPQFIREAEVLFAERNTKAGSRVVSITSDLRGERVGTLAELLPECVPHPVWRGRRIFNDWVLSSAGLSGERFCHHWALQLSDWTNPRTGERDMGLIPVWADTAKLAEVKSKGLSDYALLAKLETLDRRVKVPFAWYFYMLHGNRVHDWSGHRVIEAAEAGNIVLPEHDYRVLKGWQANEYGF